MLLPIYRSILVEVNFPSAPSHGGQQAFLDIPQLRSGSPEYARVYGIECISGTQLSTSPNNNTVVSQANAATLSLTLSVGTSIQALKDYPCTSLIASLNGGYIRWFGTMPQPGKIVGMPVNLTKSFVTAQAAGVSGGQSILFNFIYSIEKPGK